MMSNNLKRIIVIFVCIISTIFEGGCNKNNQVAFLQDFIIKQIDCETYKDINGSIEELKKVFETYFEEGAYQEYLDDVTGYMYPQLYYITGPKEVVINSIICDSIDKSEGEFAQYNFIAKYQIVMDSLTQEKEEEISMCDNIQIMVGPLGKVKKVVILNNSDIIGRLFLNAQVQ